MNFIGKTANDDVIIISVVERRHVPGERRESIDLTGDDEKTIFRVIVRKAEVRCYVSCELCFFGLSLFFSLM